MPEREFQFDARYDDAIIDDAAKTFVRRLFRKYLWLLVGACAMNIMGFVLVLVLLGSGTLMTVTIGILAALGPLYFPWEYVRLPKTLAAPMKQALEPTTRVSVSSSNFTLSAQGRPFTRRWKDLKAILEYPDYYLFVVAFLVFTFIPKRDVPQDAHELIQEAARSLMQPNLALNTDAGPSARAG